MTKPRILFMGTPAFALPAMEMLYNNHYPIMAVVTQPDRPAGRGQKEASPASEASGATIRFAGFAAPESERPVFSGNVCSVQTRHGGCSGFRSDFTKSDP